MSGNTYFTELFRQKFLAFVASISSKVNFDGIDTTLFFDETFSQGKGIVEKISNAYISRKETMSKIMMDEHVHIILDSLIPGINNFLEKNNLPHIYCIKVFLDNTFKTVVKIKSKYNIDYPSVALTDATYDGKYPEYSDVEPVDENVQKNLKAGVHPDMKTNKDGTQYSLSEELMKKNTTDYETLQMEESLIPEDKYLDRIVIRKHILALSNSDAVVNSANEALLGGGGTDKMVHYYAGASLNKEVANLPNVVDGYYYDVKCLPTDAKITTGHNLPARYIVHAVAPYLNRDESCDLDGIIKTYNKVLSFIDGEHIRSIAFPAIATRYYGLPMVTGSYIALKLAKQFIDAHPEKIDRIEFCVEDDLQHSIYQKMFCNVCS